MNRRDALILTSRATGALLTHAALNNSAYTQTSPRAAVSRTSDPPQDVLDHIKQAKTVHQFEVPKAGRTFAGQIIKTDQLIFQENARLVIECQGYPYVIILADELIFQRNYGQGEDRCAIVANPEQGVEHVNGQPGEDGTPGREFHQQAGRPGYNGSPGGNGGDGATSNLSTIYLIAFSIRSLAQPAPHLFGFTLEFDGVRGGDGGDGGHGGRGGNGEQGSSSSGGFIFCSSGPGWGGRGGNGGNGGDGGNGAPGGNGADIYIGGSPAFINAELAFTTNNHGGEPGKKGVGGRRGGAGAGGGEGDLKGSCGSAGRRGKPGKAGDSDGNDGKDNMQKGQTGSLQTAILKRSDFFP